MISDSASNAITIQSDLTSNLPYAAKFFLIYNREFINSLNQRNVTVLANQQNVANYAADDFRTELGMYDQRFMNSATRYFTKSVYIDKLNE